MAKNEKQRTFAFPSVHPELDPNPRAWMALSYAQQASFELEPALESAESPALEPNSSLVNARVAELLMSLGRIGEAECGASGAKRQSE